MKNRVNLKNFVTRPTFDFSFMHRAIRGGQLTSEYAEEAERLSSYKAPLKKYFSVFSMVQKNLVKNLVKVLDNMLLNG